LSGFYTERGVYTPITMIGDKRTLTYIIILSSVLLLVFLFDAYSASTREIIVTRKDNGFEPKVLTIKKGQTVKFATDTGEPFWPASDSHPTHGKYPEFDPEKVIEADESWVFTFEKAGVWKFHDHLNSQFTGKILVIGEEGESTKNCLEGNTDTLKAECWEAEFANIIENEGIEAGFDAFKAFYDEDALFRRNCHDVTHYIGNIAYRQFQDADKTVVRKETGFCGFGFYHGFIESALAEKGPSFYREGRNYCESLSRHPAFNLEGSGGDPTGPCIHGFGHAIFDSIEGKYWGNDSLMVKRSIDVCEKTFNDDWARGECASGVYNSLAIAYSGNVYDLEFNFLDPTSICREQNELYRHRCFMEVGIHYVRDQNFSEEKILLFIEKLRKYNGASPMIIAYTDDNIRRSTTTIDIIKLKDFCMSFQIDKDRLSCIEGTTIGLRSSGTPGKEAGRIHEFCSFFNISEPESVCN
jgi:plastocyanin